MALRQGGAGRGRAGQGPVRNSVQRTATATQQETTEDEKLRAGLSTDAAALPAKDRDGIYHGQKNELRFSERNLTLDNKENGGK